MNIVVFAAYFHPHKGGYEKYIIELYSRLLKYNNKIIIVTCNTERSPNFEIYQGLQIYRLNCWNILGGTYPIPKLNKNFISLIGKLRNEKIDIINTQTRFFVTSFFGFIFAKIYKIKHIHTEHGTQFVKLSNPITSLISRTYDMTIGRMIIHFADKVIAISNSTAEFCKLLGARNPIVVYNGIDQIKFCKNLNVDKDKYQVKNNEYVITFIGRIIEAKGVQDLISVFLKIEISNKKLLIVGDGNYFGEIKKRAENFENIILLGERSEDEIIDILSITDIFINPSYSEGLPTSVLEAISLGCSVVATNVGGTKEILSENYLYNPNDLETLKILILRNYKSRQKDKININKFYWDEIVSRLNDNLTITLNE